MQGFIQRIEQRFFISHWTNEVSNNIGSVSQAAKHTAEAAGQVLASADALTRDGDALKHQVEGFLRGVRAA